MSENTEEFIWYEVVFSLIIALVIFFVFYQNFAAAFPIGCNNNGILDNQFTVAEYGAPYSNRLEGTALFRCYLTDACYSLSLANQTCIKNWCYYTYYTNGKGNPSDVANCIAAPSSTILQNCKDLSPSNTATLFSCDQSTMAANNATVIEGCDTSNPSCISGDNPIYCSVCQGQ